MKQAELERHLRVLRQELKRAKEGSAVDSRLYHSIGRIEYVLADLDMNGVTNDRQ